MSTDLISLLLHRIGVSNMAKISQREIHDPLRWVNAFEVFLKKSRLDVYDERKVREVAAQDSASQASAIKALKRIGFLNKDGSVYRIYA